MTEYTIYVILTNRCNLNCDHCYRTDKTNKFIDCNKLTGSVASWIIQFANSHKQHNVTVHLHGGEPLLYDIKTAIEFINRIKAATSNVRVAITTNLTCKLDETIMQLFDLIDDRIIQTSWDYHIRFKNDKQLQLWKSNIKRLNQLGWIVQPTICITSKLIENCTASELYDQMLALGCKRVNFERLTVNTNVLNNNLRPTNKQLDQFLVDCYKTYVQYHADGRLQEIPLFHSIEQSISRKFVGCRARKCASTVITINPDLSIASCPNIFAATTGSFNCDQTHGKLLAIIQQESIRPNECLECEYYQYCNGDCFQLQQSTALVHDDSSCHGLKRLYQYITTAQ